MILRSLLTSLFSLLLFTRVFYAQDFIVVLKKDVPKAVTDSCQKRYPDLSVKYWMKTKKNLYKAEFPHHQDAEFSETGVWLQTRRPIKNKEIPERVKEGLSQAGYRTWKINEASFLEMAGSERSYMIEVEDKGEAATTGLDQAMTKSFRLFFTEDGILTKKVDLNPDNFNKFLHK